MVGKIKDQEDYKLKVKQAEAGKLVVVDFFATWCGPCKMIAPKIEALEKELDNVLFFKVDVDENEETAAEEDISAMPTFIFYKNGEKIKGSEVMGANEQALRDAIDRLK